MSGLLTYLRRMLGPPGEGDTTDAQLLTRFAEQRDEAAFEALVRRYGPMVYGVCRRLLSNPPDAEDAFQATFLVLARKAAVVSKRELVGHWLYAVAYRIARKARANLARRQIHEKQASAMSAAEPSYDLAWQETGSLFDEEVNRLPGKYRLPVLLCYVEGLTKAEAARRLGWPEGTISARLARAREMLRVRLQRKGAALPVGLFTALLAPESLSAAVAPALVSTTTQAATAFAAGTTATEGLLSASAAALAKGALRSMFLKKMQWPLAVLLLAGLTALGGVSAYPRLAAEPAPPPVQAGKEPERAASRQPARPATQPGSELKLYVAGAGAPRPGVYSLKAEATYRDVLQAAGVDLNRVRGQGQVAYLIQLSPAWAGASHSGELTRMLNQANETFTVVTLVDPANPGKPLPRLILWIGPAEHWDLFQRSTRQAKVIAGANAEQKASELRRQGIPAKAVTSSEQGFWPPQYDELMSQAEQAHKAQKQAGGESWLAGAEDEALVRKAVKDYVDAAVKGDEATVARLFPGKSPEGRKSAMADLKEMIAGGATPAEIRFVTLAPDRALVVSDFFAFQEGRRPRRMVCLVYTLRRQKDGWVLRDIDVEDVDGLIKEVRDFDRETRPDK